MSRMLALKVQQLFAEQTDGVSLRIVSAHPNLINFEAEGEDQMIAVQFYTSSTLNGAAWRGGLCDGPHTTVGPGVDGFAEGIVAVIIAELYGDHGFVPAWIGEVTGV